MSAATPSDRFLQACRGAPHDRTPVWFMRQAGRYQPEYRKLRERYSLLEIALTPRLACEVTALPVEQFGVDAAILFSDIMVPLGPAGVDYEIREGVGPVVAHPIRTRADVERLTVYDPATALPEVLEAVRLTADRIRPVPVIGFAGGPFTLASYLVEGRPDRRYLAVKRMMWSEPDTWGGLMERLAAIVVAQLRAQVAAGARAVQIFDSWVGALAPDDFRHAVLPTMQQIFAELADLAVPRIYFGVETAGLLDGMRQTGADVLGLDWRVELPGVRRMFGPQIALQGNLDPAALLAPWPVVERHARRLLTGMRGDPAYIFNLGHGVLPETDPATIRALTALVHEEG